VTIYEKPRTGKTPKKEDGKKSVVGHWDFRGEKGYGQRVAARGRRTALGVERKGLNKTPNRKRNRAASPRNNGGGGLPNVTGKRIHGFQTAQMFSRASPGRENRLTNVKKRKTK